MMTRAVGNASRSRGVTLESRTSSRYAAAGAQLVIRKVYVKVKPQVHSEEVLADLATLQAPK